MRSKLRFIFRGATCEIDGFAPSTMLLDWLRETMRATGTKEGCNEGDCGACTVVLVREIAGRLVYSPVNACILLLGQVDGAEILTVEDLAEGHGPEGHPVQAAMVRHHASQCGFCTPGIVMSLFAAWSSDPRPACRAAINDCLAGNLCRCTGYRPIVDAAIEAMAIAPPAGRDEARMARRLIELNDAEDVLIGDETRFFASPASLDSLATLASRHPEATLLGGATDVGLWVTKRLLDLPKVIWIGRVPELGAIELFDDALFLGAGVTLGAALSWLDQSAGRIDDAELPQGLRQDLELLLRRFGSMQVRASGTIGGNIANGSPIGDLAPALIALDATLHLRRGETRRLLALEDFFREYGRQDRAPGEIVTGISIPHLGGQRHFRAFKISKRFDEDISAVMGAFTIALVDRRVAGARIAFGGMAGTPKRALRTEMELEGVSIDHPGEWAKPMRALEADYQPIDDLRASARYRSRVARALLGKALTEIAGARSLTRISAALEASPGHG